MQAARALGVSVSTVKRWVDEKVLPAHRTVGGHRKLLMADVIRLVREGHLPQADLSRLMPCSITDDPADPRELRDQLLVALKKADHELVRSIIQGAYRNGISLDVLADHVISPAMYTIGHEWETGKIEVFHEHRATQAVLAALYELHAQIRTKAELDRPVAVGGAPEGDHSILPSLLVKMVLLDNGWDAINLGPHTPMSAFHVTLRELEPQLIWISASHVIDPEKFVAEYTAFYRQAEKLGVAVVLGGSALTQDLRSRLPCTTFGNGLGHLVSFARLLHRGPSLPRRGRPPADSGAAG